MNKKSLGIIFTLEDICSVDSYKIKNIRPAYGVSEEELLEVAAYAECLATHSVASIITGIYGDVNKNFVGDFAEIEGKGVIAEYDFSKIYAGNRKLLYENNIEFEVAKEEGTIIYVAKGEKYLGYINLDISIKEETKEFFKKLADNNVEAIMLTGNKKDVAEKVASEIGITNFYFSLLEEEKINKINEIVKNNKYILCGKLVKNIKKIEGDITPVKKLDEIEEIILNEKKSTNKININFVIGIVSIICISIILFLLKTPILYIILSSFVICLICIINAIRLKKKD